MPDTPQKEHSFTELIRRRRLHQQIGLLCYANKTFWYDAHPLIIPMLEETRATSQSGEEE